MGMKIKSNHSSWRTFTAAPHRVMFLGGAFQGVATILWWFIDLMGRFGGFYQPVIWTISSVWAHAYLMIYGFFPFFIFGFLLTTYPRWMMGEEIDARFYVPAFLGLAGGVILFYIGLMTTKFLLMIGVFMMMSGWGVALVALLNVFFTSRHSDKRHQAVTSAALMMGWLGSGAFLLWLLTENPLLLKISWIGGIWFFLLPLLVAVSHLMIPFFSSAVMENLTFVRRYPIFWIILACIITHGVLELFDAYRFRFIPDLLLLNFSLYLSFQWGFFKSFKNRLLAVLHIGFAWLSAAIFLYLIQSLALLAGDGGISILSLAPLHALTIGFFGSMVLGMASRVTLGHSGRPLVADKITWSLFLLFQTSALSRIFADIFINTGFNGTHLYLVAAILWLATYLPWGIKYGMIYLRPRADGRPG